MIKKGLEHAAEVASQVEGGACLLALSEIADLYAAVMTSMWKRELQVSANGPPPHPNLTQSWRCCPSAHDIRAGHLWQETTLMNLLGLGVKPILCTTPIKSLPVSTSRPNCVSGCYLESWCNLKVNLESDLSSWLVRIISSWALKSGTCFYLQFSTLFLPQHASGSKRLQVPLMAALFHNNCLYLAQEFVLQPLYYPSLAPRQLEDLSIFASLSALRASGRAALDGIVRHLQLVSSIDESPIQDCGLLETSSFQELQFSKIYYMH